MTAFDRGMRWLMRPDVEKGWYNGLEARDKNPTMDGVTQAVYNRWRQVQGQPVRTVAKMEPNERDSVYRTLYWTKGKCEDIAKRSEVVAIVHFDACVNHGVASPNNDKSAGAIELLQRTLGVNDDGVFGPITWENFINEMTEDGEVKLATRYLKIREAQYRHLAEMAPNTLGLNLNGWLKRLQKLGVFLALPQCV